MGIHTHKIKEYWLINNSIYFVWSCTCYEDNNKNILKVITVDNENENLQIFENDVIISCTDYMKQKIELIKN